ncbi:hypothetical protein LX32DRAFT_658606 [Colletotrichum zoysiae]|uniref:Uncharacterized protein n=1 Tax=Colletotrichum zoysiae TaxID=1216348 RepID=A0AAD9H458_9PEZI|nr:hypothetical protein LX32DRAFT_658606 [Colletotrichum zoysiae]
MSVLLGVQHELGKVFNIYTGFKGVHYPNQYPCTACVGSLHRHVSLECCSGHVRKLCVICEEEGKECRAIPWELLGVAQYLWNQAKEIVDKRFHEDKDLDGLRRWRLHRSLQRACTAWNELLEFLDQPMELGDDVTIEAVKVQELILSREISIIKLLWDANIESCPKLIPSADDLSARLAALAPPWSRPTEPARRLKEAVAAIPLAAYVPVPGVAEEGRLSEFPQLVSADVVAKLARFSGNCAPTCLARYPRMRLRICEGGSERTAGGGPSSREARDQGASAGGNEQSGPGAGGRRSTAVDGHLLAPDPAPQPKPEPDAETCSGIEPAKDDGVEVKEEEGEGDDDENENETETETEAGPATRSRGKRPAPDGEGPDEGDEVKPRKRTRGRRAAAAGK